MKLVHFQERICGISTYNCRYTSCLCSGCYSSPKWTMWSSTHEIQRRTHRIHQSCQILGLLLLCPNWKIPVNPARQFDRSFFLHHPLIPRPKSELDELNQLAATRSNPNVVTTITVLDPPGSNYNLYFDYLIQKYKYSPPLAAQAAMLNEGVYSGLWLRGTTSSCICVPVPDQVTGYTFQLGVNPAVRNGPTLPTYHPAYPSGHPHLLVYLWRLVQLVSPMNQWEVNLQRSFSAGKEAFTTTLTRWLEKL